MLQRCFSASSLNSFKLCNHCIALFFHFVPHLSQSLSKTLYFGILVMRWTEVVFFSSFCPVLMSWLWVIKTTEQLQCSLIHTANVLVNLMSHEVYKCAEVNQHRNFLSSHFTPCGKEDREQDFWLFLLHCLCNCDLYWPAGNQDAEIPESF